MGLESAEISHRKYTQSRKYAKMTQKILKWKKLRSRKKLQIFHRIFRNTENHSQSCNSYVWASSVSFFSDGHADAAMSDSCRMMMRICGHVGCVSARGKN